MNVTGGDTDITTYFMLRTAADGTAATGLTITDFDLQYVRTGAAPSAKVDATELAAIDGAHEANKAKEVDGTDAPGLYRVDQPDAAFAAGVPEVILTVKCATCFTEHLAVQIDPPVNVTKWLTQAVTADSNVPEVHVVGLDADVITNAHIADDAFAVEQFKDACLTAAKLASGAITVAKIAANALTAEKFAADCITAAKIAAGAIDNATFAADVGSTVYATNIIALAVAKAIVENKLDHLVAVADSDDVADNAIMAKLAASDGDWSGFAAASHALEAIRNTLDNLGVSVGDGSVEVSHNYGGTDALAYTISPGVGIDNATVRAYLKADYDAYNRSPAYRKGTTTTDVNGRWSSSLWLDPETYTIVFEKQGRYGENTQEVTVT